MLGLGIVSVGALQHRLAGLGHEAAHYSLLKNKILNDLIGDIFCMFPILSTIHFYRLFHMAHHQYTNDPTRDPDLVTLGGAGWSKGFRCRGGNSSTAARSPDVHRTPCLPQIRARLHRHQRAGPVGERLPQPHGRVARNGPRLASAGGGARARLFARLYRGTVGDHAGGSAALVGVRGDPRHAPRCGDSPGAAPDGLLQLAIPPGLFRPDLRRASGWCIFRGFWSRWGYSVLRQMGDRPSTSGFSGSFP